MKQKNGTLKCLKMTLLDCAINEKCCSVDGGGGICPLFRPHPREFAIQGKKNANAEGSGPEGGGGRLSAAGID